MKTDEAGSKLAMPYPVKNRKIVAGGCSWELLHLWWIIRFKKKKKDCQSRSVTRSPDFYVFLNILGKYHQSRTAGWVWYVRILRRRVGHPSNYLLLCTSQSSQDRRVGQTTQWLQRRLLKTFTAFLHVQFLWILGRGSFGTCEIMLAYMNFSDPAQWNNM